MTTVRNTPWLGDGVVAARAASTCCAWLYELANRKSLVIAKIDDAVVEEAAIGNAHLAAALFSGRTVRHAVGIGARVGNVGSVKVAVD